MIGRSTLTLMMALLLPPRGAPAQESGARDFFQHLQWRQIGPAVFGGRIPGVEAVPANPAVAYVAGSTGGSSRTKTTG